MLTNEENKVGVYSESDTPTNSAKITPNTPIKDLNLNWSEKVISTPLIGLPFYNEALKKQEFQKEFKEILNIKLQKSP